MQSITKSNQTRRKTSIKLLENDDQHLGEKPLTNALSQRVNKTQIIKFHGIQVKFQLAIDILISGIRHGLVKIT